MNHIEHLLVTLAEECSEVAKEASKALRFGLDDGYPGKGKTKTNRETIIEEFNDLYAVMEMLADQGIFKQEDLLNREAIKNKKKKVKHYMLYAIGKQTLQKDNDKK